MRPALRWVAVCLLLPLLAGCATLGYYWQSVSGHLSLMQAARPIEQWLEGTRASEALKDKLRLAGRMRAFAAQQLHLPDNASYQSYADLGRPAVVWNVVAAPEWSLEPKQWCFLVAGCVSYKGYFDEAAARLEAQRVAALGLETTVQPVPAYSTLGWLNWAGGDPLLNTFIGYPEGELARLIFHELAHQVVYVADDTAFNESFATAVERLGAQLWLEQASAAAREEYAVFDARRRRPGVEQGGAPFFAAVYASTPAAVTCARSASCSRPEVVQRCQRPCRPRTPARVAKTTPDGEGCGF